MRRVGVRYSNSARQCLRRGGVQGRSDHRRGSGGSSGGLWAILRSTAGGKRDSECQKCNGVQGSSVHDRSVSPPRRASDGRNKVRIGTVMCRKRLDPVAIQQWSIPMCRPHCSLALVIPHLPVAQHPSSMFRSLTASLTALSSSLSAQITFTSSGSFVVPPGVGMTIELVGPGGNGASNGGGGGGGGAFASGVYEVTPGTSYSVVVGTSGSGTATSISSLGISACAGGNATTTPDPNIGGGGSGGVAQGGGVNRNGGSGGGGYWTYFGGGGGGAGGPTANGGAGGNTVVWTGGNCLTPGGAAGVGGEAPGGGGGKGAGFTDNNCSVSNPAANGRSYGGGGGNGIGSPVGIGGGG